MPDQSDSNRSSLISELAAGAMTRSGAVLVAANLLPLIGVILWNWDAFTVVVLYWMENIIIGLINVMKMLVSSPANLPDSTSHHNDKPEISEYSGCGPHAFKLFLIPFFIVHYGLFCTVHGAFVFGLLGGLSGGGGFELNGIDRAPDLLRGVFGGTGFWFIAAIVISHLASFFWNFIGKGEFRRIGADELMQSVYPRMMVLHVAIVVGAFVVMTLGSPLFLLAILIVGKTALDLKLHLREHRKLNPTN